MTKYILNIQIYCLSEEYECSAQKERGIEQGGISFAPSFDSFSAGFGISNLNRQANIVFEFLVDSLSAVTVCVQFN